MNREEFLNSLWKPYPNGAMLSEGLQCFRFSVVSANNPELKEMVEDEKLGLSCPIDCLRENDWVAWCEKRGVYFLLSPSLGPSPQAEDRDMKSWAQFLDQVRRFFNRRGFAETLTPYLVPSPGVDHHIDFFQVIASKTGRRWTLPTSPEIHLKKQLCQGHEKIFEIKQCFRDDLPGENHSAEFTMLEWYRAFVPLEKIGQDLNELLQCLKPGAPKIAHFTVSQLFKEKLGMKLTSETSLNELKKCAKKCEIEFAADDDWNDLFFRIFMEKIEPNLGKYGPVLVWDYPRQQASLAQISEEGWAKRFELYWEGVELANAYLEVNDPKENRQRFEDEAEKRRRDGVLESPLDENFFEWMSFGMPPASGIALGLDRLFRVLRA